MSDDKLSESEITSGGAADDRLSNFLGVVDCSTSPGSISGIVIYIFYHREGLARTCIDNLYY
jgi:hypothetical protein